ncbi:hypothetical protein CYMTET_53707 [Cymbomonas tetramitiformis]|uniref:Arrestin-like N-terminal domain-containing protein n=1 Tax=Cymbomonas tetramitiformis TaxID=36881 RepID=A0AAE0ERG5_9CHLO|nr:hypothetical protein CYMTET_53707 [Cymbomonas tetramitiformis]
MSIKKFEIVLDRKDGVFWAGETVRGKVILDTEDDLQTRGVRVRLTGLAHGQYTRGSGDDERNTRRTQVLEDHRHTVFGNYFTTAVLPEAGADPTFGRAPGDGTMYIPFDGSKLELVLRVMDQDFGTRDDLLGEVLLDASTLARSGATQSLRLQSQGVPGDAQITVSAVILPANHILPEASGEDKSASLVVADHAFVCALVVHKATGLRSGDWLDGNDVYVQAYRRPRNLNTREAFPSPDAKAILRTRHVAFPFAFPLSVDAPGTAELSAGRHTAFIRYYLYANVDGPSWQDPSVKVPITVVPIRSMAPTTPLFSPLVVGANGDVYGYVLCCGSMQLGADGELEFSCKLAKQFFCPGERLSLSGQAGNSTSHDATFRVDLVCHILLCQHAHRQTVVTLFEVDVKADEKYTFDPESEVYLPAVPPSFFGSQWGSEIGCQDPVKWTYSLALSFEAGSRIRGTTDAQVKGGGESPRLPGWSEIRNHSPGILSTVFSCNCTAGVSVEPVHLRPAQLG